VTLAGRPAPIPLLDHATALLRRGDAAAARQAFQHLFESGHEDIDVCLGLAYACAAEGDAAATMAAVDGALRLDPRELRALLLKADLLERRGDPLADGYYGAALKIGDSLVAPPAALRAALEQARGALARSHARYESQLRQHLTLVQSETGPLTERFERSLDLLTGKRRLYVQKPTLYHFPDLPQRQFFNREEFSWIAAFETHTAEIRAELQAVMASQPEFEPYLKSDPTRPTLNPTPLIDRPDWGAYFLFKDGEPVPAHAARCPRTMAALAEVPLLRIPRRSPNVLFSLLKPGTHIPPHNGFVNTRLIAHLPLIVPPDCRLRVGNETRSWEEGRTWLFDDTIEHEAWNDSDDTRVVLLFEVWRPELDSAERAQVTALFEAIEKHRGGIAGWGI